MSLKFILALVVAISITAEFAHGQYASFYPLRHCEGHRFGAELTYGCQNIPTWLQKNWDKLSLNTNGACVTVYDQEGCEGRELANFNAARCRNIAAIGRVRSFRRCSGRTNSALISG